MEPLRFPMERTYPLSDGQPAVSGQEFDALTAADPTTELENERERRPGSQR
jgi:hypothetical protein